MRSQILHGKTWHCRYQPNRHAFTYPMIWLCIDLDELPTLNRCVGLFGYNRRAPISVRDADYVSSAKIAIREKVRALLARENICETIGRIDLITLPRVFGYAFNPVSFFRCYDLDGRFTVLVAEVGNTFGEKHHYVLRPVDGPAAAGEALRFRCPKAFYVSPFNRVEGDYEVRWLEQSDSLWLEIELHRAGERVMSAGMSGRAVPLTTRSLAASAVRLPIMVASVIPRISWQALQLHLGKRVPMFDKPAPISAATIPAQRHGIFDRLRARFVRWAALGRQLPRAITPVLSLPKENPL